MLCYCGCHGSQISGTAGSHVFKKQRKNNRKTMNIGEAGAVFFAMDLK